MWVTSSPSLHRMWPSFEFLLTRWQFSFLNALQGNITSCSALFVFMRYPMRNRCERFRVSQLSEWIILNRESFQNLLETRSDQWSIFGRSGNAGSDSKQMMENTHNIIAGMFSEKMILRAALSHFSIRVANKNKNKLYS